MKNLKNSTVAMLSAAIFLSVLSSCKKDDNSNNGQNNNTKTLNKNLLVGKKWYSQNSALTHDIKTNGVYGVGGTWEWKNNTDTMTIDLDGSGSVNSPVDWKFFWSAEKEMACKRASSGSGEILFKDQPW